MHGEEQKLRTGRRIVSQAGTQLLDRAGCAQERRSRHVHVLKFTAWERLYYDVQTRLRAEWSAAQVQQRDTCKQRGVHVGRKKVVLVEFVSVLTMLRHEEGKQRRHVVLGQDLEFRHLLVCRSCHQLQRFVGPVRQRLREEVQHHANSRLRGLGVRGEASRSWAMLRWRRGVPNDQSQLLPADRAQERRSRHVYRQPYPR